MSIAAGSTLIEVTTTVASQIQARELASVLLQHRLAACVQVTAVESHYRWQGELQQEQEYQLRLKTRQDRFQSIARLLAERHPYELPQLLATEITGSSEAYAAWLHQQLED
ncbi:divalent-cation tolerance protein CutA [Frateuria aurantia]|uniref:Uncharacterized protein involved in tolerance to divalent cations n=1 Tax=Frateuria aurantia (strain ATCC 33424 / DSM 6220 / KCTC 2777 / LMG 1558 / NBRC 3245 / NCIMB 13370) TaxID=767434 RepID=H8L2X0_FRAAD|nr:divalent-cation tolerance protein CutA [Frateuria aurantia]AFC87326.1 uncharacterized protein involved in tolerance to divalent cations [Frateuria aurantia DSM 6220]